MLYVKNVPGWERWMRILSGVALLILGLSDLLGLQGSPLGWAVAVTGVVTLGTGFIGFCPMCALVGRKGVLVSRKP